MELKMKTTKEVSICSFNMYLIDSVIKKLLPRGKYTCKPKIALLYWKGIDGGAVRGDAGAQLVG